MRRVGEYYFTPPVPGQAISDNSQRVLITGAGSVANCTTTVKPTLESRLVFRPVRHGRGPWGYRWQLTQGDAGSPANLTSNRGGLIGRISQPREHPLLTFPEENITVGPERRAVPHLGPAARPADRKPVDRGGRAEPEHDPAVIAGQVAAAPLDPADQRPTAHVQRQHGPSRIPVGLPDQSHAEPVVATRVHVAQKCNRLVAMADHHVHPAVVVQVRECDRAATMAAAHVGVWP